MDEKLQKLYDRLGQKYNLPDFEQWKESLSDPVRLKKAHDFAKENFNGIGTIDEFQQDLFPVKKKDGGQPSYPSSGPQSSIQTAVPTAESSYSDPLQPWQADNQQEAPGVLVPKYPPIMSVPADLGPESAHSNIYTTAYQSLKQRRKGNLTDDATVIQADQIQSSKKLKRTPLEEQTLQQEKDLYASVGVKDNPFVPVGDRATQEEFSAMSRVLSNENKEIKLAIDKLNSDLIIAPEEEKDLVRSEINQLESLYDKNVAKFRSEMQSGRYKTVEDVQQYFQDRQKEADKAQKEGSVVGNIARSGGRILLNSSAKAVQSIARLTDVVEKAAGMEGDKPGFGDFIQEYAINTAEDLEAAFPAPTNLSRGVSTDTAKWGNYQVDFDPDGNIQSIRDKDGFAVDVPLNKEQEATIKALPKSQQFNRKPLVYQAGSTIADVLVQVAGAKGISGLKALPTVNASRMGAAIGVTELGSNVGLIAANTAMMSNQLYNEGKEAGFSDEASARYALAGGVAVGAMGAHLGIGIEAKMLGKGTFITTPNFGTSLKGAIAKKFTDAVYAGGGEMVEEAVTENAMTASIQAMMNATSDGHFDIGENFEKNKLITEATLGFIAGNLLDISTGKSINRLQKDALIEASKDIEGSIEVTKATAAAIGAEFTEVQENDLRSKLEQTAKVVSLMPEEHVGNQAAVDAMSEKVKIDEEIEMKKEAIKGKDPAMTQPQKNEIEELQKKSDEAAMEVAATTGIEPDAQAKKRLEPEKPTEPTPKEKKMVKADKLVEGQTYFSDETQREYIYRGDKDGMAYFEKVPKKGETLMNTHIDAIPDGRFVNGLTTEEVATEPSPATGSTSTGDDISAMETRMQELEAQMANETDRDKKQILYSEFNDLEKKTEKIEWDSVFSKPLDQVGQAVDDLMKKEEDMPNGYGAFMDRSDARQTKAVAKKYSDPDNVSDDQIKEDFKDAMLGSPSTWYADGLKLREAYNLAGKRGITATDLLNHLESEYLKDGISEEDAKEVIADKLATIFAGSEKVEEPIGIAAPVNAPTFDDTNTFTPIDETGKVAGARIFNEPVPIAVDLDKKLAKLPAGRPIFKLNRGRSKRIADEYEAMEHDPTNPDVQAAYEAMASETMEQFGEIQKQGVRVEIYQGEGEPYASSQGALDDLRNNKHLFVLSTEKEFGSEPISDKARSENPLLKDSGAKDVNGVPLLINDVFRFVHDFFGHGVRGNSFGPTSEENAWDVHARMYSPLARRAMTTETRGQNSWVNFSGKNDAARAAQKEARKLRQEGKNDEADKLLAENPLQFAPQKIGLMPEWVSEPYAAPQEEAVAPVTEAPPPPPPPSPPAEEEAPKKPKKRKMRGFYENSLPKMKDKTPGQAVLATIAERSPQFYSKMNIKEEADAIAKEIDEKGMDAVVQMAISPPDGENPVKTMARRVVALIAIGDAIALANNEGDVDAVDIMSSQADTIEKLIAERATTAGQENAFIAFYSMTPEGMLARHISKAARIREEMRAGQNESGEIIGKVVDDIANEVADIDMDEEIKETVTKAKNKVQAVKKSTRDVEAAKKKLDAARAKLRRAVTGKLNTGLDPAVVSALVDVFKAHVEVIGANIQKLKTAYLKDAKDLNIDEKSAWEAVASERASIEKVDADVERAVIGFFKGSSLGSLSDALVGAGLSKPEADAMAKEISADFKKKADAKVRQRLSTIVRNNEKSEKKAKLIENAVLEAIMLKGLNKPEIKKAIEEKYGIKSFTDREIAELNIMVRDAKDLPSDRLKRAKMIEIMDYVQRKNGEDPIDIIHSFWFASVLSDIKTWGTVAIGNIGNFFNQYLYYGTLTEAGRFAMTESAYRVFNPKSQAGIWFGLSEFGEFIRHGSGFKSQDKIMKSSVLERVSRTQYTSDGMKTVAKLAAGARYAGRIMSAVDAIMFYSAFDFNMERVAYESAQGEGLKGEAAAARAREIVGRSREAMDAKAVAARKELTEYAKKKGKTFEEVFTERDVAYRVREMAMDAIDRAGGNSAKVQLLAEEVALQNDPRGLWGVIAKFIGGNFPQVFDTKNIKPTGNKLLDSVVKNSANAMRIYSGFMFPFMKTAANMINMSVDFVPGVGMLQKLIVDNSLSSVTQGKVAPTLDWSNLDDRQVFLARQVTGAILVMILGAAFGGDDDDMYITGQGPSDFNKKAQLYEQGWKPFTVRIGGKNYYYRDSPLAIVLAYLGAQNDHRKYNAKDDEPMQFGDSIMAAMFAYLTNASFLQTLNDLTSSFQESNASKIKIALTRPISGFTNPGVARMVDRWVSPELRDAKTIEDRWWASVVGNTMVVNNINLELKYNSIGDKIDPYKTMGMFAQITGTDKYISPGTPSSDVFEVLADKNVFFPKVTTSNVKHLDGTPMKYDETRDYGLIIAKYRGMRHKPNVAKMKMMTASELEDKLKAVDEEGKIIAKMLLFENRNINLSPEKIDEIIVGTNIEEAKRFKKKVAKSLGKKEDAPLSKELDY